MTVPIVMAAFGTSTRARQTYKIIDEHIQSCFPDHPIHWAFTSRMVRDKIQQEQGKEFTHPHQVLNELWEQGHEWAVVQSLHLVCGHEFDRLVEEAKTCLIRTSIGLPLLDAPEDYSTVVRVLDEELEHRDRDEALVLVGHGTDHAIWTAYPCLESMARKHLGDRVFVGVVEGWPEAEVIVQDVVQAGFKRARLVPLMLVAGIHFQDDLAGEEGSWKELFREQGVEVSIEERSLGHMSGIIDLFGGHIRDALAVIPDSDRSRVEV